jgi:hypothetical protein
MDSFGAIGRIFVRHPPQKYLPIFPQLTQRLGKMKSRSLIKTIIVDITESLWNQLTTYIFRWYAVLSRSVKVLTPRHALRLSPITVPHIGL